MLRQFTQLIWWGSGVASIFVSHSSQDAEQATRLLAWLRAQGFDETFLDIEKHGGIALLGASGRAS
jgi:hypothetical protein